VSAPTAFRLGVWIGVAVVAFLAAPSLPPADPTLHPVGDALVAGCLTGIGLFAILARRRARLVALATLPRRQLIARSVVLTARSAYEEAVWRALLLGLLAAPLGPVAALSISTLLFAGSHVGRQGRAAAAHVLTGASFGGVYLATGRLHAAIAAHGAYNVLVGANALSRETVSVPDTGRRRRSLVASKPLLRRSEPMPNPTPTSRSPVATLERASKRFGAVDALDDVDLELRRGEILALLGPNGAGKSTAVSILLGLRRPDDGRATLFGEDPRSPPARRRVGAVLQEVGFPPGLRVCDAVELVRAHFPEAPRTDALERLGLATLEHRDAGGLSGGQRRRLAVALALSGDPEALFLDEPTAGMDATARRGLLSDLRDFAARTGSVLLTTQQLAEVEEVATRIVILFRGRVLFEGSVADVRSRAGKARVTVTAASLPPLRTAATVDSRGDRHVVYVDDAESLVSELVLSGTAFSDLEVVPVSLEDAFVALTTEAER
jgi:ABC-2 type transport system ATP-binding protein